MREEDVVKIFSFLPSSAILVGGHALTVWAILLKMPLIIGEQKQPISEDIDFCGGQYVLDHIAQGWSAKVEYMDGMIETNLVGQATKYFTDPVGYRSVDVIHKVRGLDSKVVEGRAIEVFCYGRTIRVLHPLDLLKARIINVAEIENKQTQHHADQIDLAITIANTYLNLRVKQYQRNKDSNILNSVIKDTKELVSYIFDDQLFKTTRYWRLKITDVIPLEALKSIENCSELSDFVNVEWPVIIATTNKMRLTKKISELSDKFKNKYKP